MVCLVGREAVVRMGGQFLILHIKYEPPTRPRTLSKVGSGCGWNFKRLCKEVPKIILWAKGILKIYFDQQLGVRLETGAKLNIIQVNLTKPCQV